MSDAASMHVWTTRLSTNGQVYVPELREQRSSRATRIIDDPKRLLFLSVPRTTSDDVEGIIRQRVSGLIVHGLSWDGQRYAFLGFTDKHVTEGTLVLFREDSAWTASRFLQALGNLNTVYTRSGYGRFAVCLGLSFAVTTDVLDVPNERVAVLDDLYSPDGSLYTKSCGIIRDSVARRICENARIPPDTSVFLMQRGGWTGEFVRYPDDTFSRLCSAARGLAGQGPSIEDCWIACRRSMCLHDGQITTLEILGCSRRTGPARLTAETILKLCTLGTTMKIEQTVEELLEDELSAIASIPRDLEQATRCVTNELQALPTVFNSELHSVLLAKHDLKECYVEWMLKIFQHQQYQSLQQNLSVHVEESARLYGVIDEEGILGEDEVFVNLSGGKGVLSGRRLLVIRESSLSIADVWNFKAVRCERLRHLTNCIVFSRRSKHAVLQSVAALAPDQHQYFVTWNPSLVVPTQTITTSCQSRMGSRWCDIKIEGSAKIVGSAALDTFMLHKFGMLKEDMMKRWYEYATRSEALAHDSQAQALQPLIDCTLDGLHSSAFMRTLQEEFSAVQQADRAGQRQLHFTNPLDKLRARIPKCETPAIVGYAFDPILDLRDHDEHAWDDSYREATDVYCRFCQDLEEALKRDGMATSDGHGVLTHGISTSYSHADGVFASYRGRYFEGDSSFTKHIQSIRASAWYYFGYAQKNPAFAWLGLAYLNRIRNDRVTQGPSTSIGAASGALGGTTSSTSSASCVSSTATVVGMSLSLKEAASRGARRAQENLRSVEKNPTPRYPVASNPPPCVNAPEHKWRMGPTNGFARRYDCETCGVRVKERKEGVYWVEDVVTSAKAAQGPRRIAKLPRPIKVANAGREPVQRGVEAPSVKGEDIDDKKGILNPAATSARAIGTSPKSLKDSSQRDVKPVPSSTARGQPSTTNGLLISRSSISTGIKSRPTGSDLVCNNAKPSAPVAAHPGLAECRSDQHLWHCRWANGYARHYICKWCSIVVKEHKRNDRWVAY